MKPENNLNNRINSPQAKIPQEPKTENIRQGFRRVSSVPTRAPRDYYESILIYTSGATYRLYVYDEVASAWRYATLT